MIQIKSLNKIVNNRKEAKDILGGTRAYNHALRNKDLYFIENNNVANNERNENSFTN